MIVVFFFYLRIFEYFGTEKYLYELCYRLFIGGFFHGCIGWFWMFGEC